MISLLAVSTAWAQFGLDKLKDKIEFARIVAFADDQEQAIALKREMLS